jgi:hypothetical protein
MASENWVNITGYEGKYMASESGLIKSCERHVKHSKGGLQILKEKILKQTITKSGYLTVALSVDGNTRTFAVHQLIALAFLTKKKPSDVVDHINGVKHDNRVVNLRYCSQRENLGRLTTSTGVSLNSDRYKKRYRARIRVKGKMIDLGSYHTKEEAAKSYQTAKNKYE